MQEILLGDANVALVGGTESMSQAPFVARNIRFGTKFGTEPKVIVKCFIDMTNCIVSKQI